MPLKIFRSTSNTTLWNTCAGRFLSAVVRPEPDQHAEQLWLTHRIQRDWLYEAALERGLRGWLNPPVQFLSALPQLFDIRGTTIGTLTRREVISRIAFEQGTQHGIRVGNVDATITRGNMLDSFVGELLPEGVSGSELHQALDRLETDEFGARRNAWLAAVYAQYLGELEAMRVYDPRSIHALVADRIDAGELQFAVKRAQRLHIYGLYSARARVRLLSALARQPDVDVVVYTSSQARDLERLANDVEELPADTSQPVVQPTPDAQRELQWVAERVKRLIVEERVRPHDIAVVARTGLHDTRRAMRALERAGVPATARVRTRLSEVSALKALLELFRGPAQDWSYRVLRNLLASPYFRFRIDLRPFDAIACQARPCSLSEWEEQLAALLSRLQAEEDPDARRIGLRKERVVDDLDRFRSLRAELEMLDGDKPLGQWIELARTFLTDRTYRFRQRVCDPPNARQDVVRIDQRGVKRFEALLAEWSAADDLQQTLTPVEWFRSLRALLEGQELVLTTPGQKGVQVLEAHDAALAPFRAVFLIHANDAEFPKVTAPGGLFSQEERSRLRSFGLHLDDRVSTLERERVLWSAVVGAPAVSITYHTTDPNGTPLLPSLLVPPHDEETELPRSTSETAALNREQEARSAAARAYEVLRTDASARVQAADVAALQRAMLNAYAEAQRGAPEREVAAPNPWNGHLRDPVVLEKLAAKYHDDYLWSVSQLQTYTTCPFFFLIERVLGLKSIEEADEDTNALASGGVAHEVLERFYSGIIDRTSPPFDAQHFVDLAAEVFVEWQRSHEWLGIRALWEQRRHWLTQTLLEFVDWDIQKHLSKGQAVTKCEFEIGENDLGIALQGDDVTGTPRRMVLRGRIDRIDRNKKGELEVIDYKSGRMPAGTDGYADGAVLQGPVYLHALRSQGLDATKAMYRSLKERGNGAALTIDKPQYDMALRIAFTVPQRVRAGLFECVLASSAKEWSAWHPDLAVRRTDAIVQNGSRFDD